MALEQAKLIYSRSPTINIQGLSIKSTLSSNPTYDHFTPDGPVYASYLPFMVHCWAWGIAVIFPMVKDHVTGWHCYTVYIQYIYIERDAALGHCGDCSYEPHE